MGSSMSTSIGSGAARSLPLDVGIELRGRAVALEEEPMGCLTFSTESCGGSGSDGATISDERRTDVRVGSAGAGLGAASAETPGGGPLRERAVVGILALTMALRRVLGVGPCCLDRVFEVEELASGLEPELTSWRELRFDSRGVITCRPTCDNLRLEGTKGCGLTTRRAFSREVESSSAPKSPTEPLNSEKSEPLSSSSSLSSGPGTGLSSLSSQSG